MKKCQNIQNQAEINENQKILKHISAQFRNQANIFKNLMNYYLLTFFDSFLEDLYQKFVDSKLDESFYLLILIILIELINGIISFAFFLKYNVYRNFTTEFFLIIGIKIFALLLHLLVLFQYKLSCIPKWIWTILSYTGMAIGDCIYFYNQLKFGSEFTFLSNLLTFGIGLQYFCCINLHIRHFGLSLLIFVFTYIAMILISFSSIVIECKPY